MRRWHPPASRKRNSKIHRPRHNAQELNMKVNEAMTAPVKCCSPDTSLDEVARMMWTEDCGAIPVVAEGNRPVGIVTDRDIAMAAMLNHAPLWGITASQVIQGQQLVSCSEKESIESCVRKMEQCAVRRIVVTDAYGSLCGILSLGDAVAFTERDTDADSIPAIESEQLLGMLRKVSAHHPSENPLSQIH
jgi:CBS domain-containing protein